MQRHSVTSTPPRSSPSSYISCLRRIGLVVCPSRAAIVRWARCVFLSCARAISCALVQVGRDAGRAHDLGDHALDLLVDHRSFVHLGAVVPTARTTRVFAGSGEAPRALSGERERTNTSDILRRASSLGASYVAHRAGGWMGAARAPTLVHFESVVRKS